MTLQDKMRAVALTHDLLMERIDSVESTPQYHQLYEDVGVVLRKYRDDKSIGATRDDFVIACLISAASAEMSEDSSVERLLYFAQLAACCGERVAREKRDSARSELGSNPVRA
jgi:hypothetical protein